MDNLTPKEKGFKAGKKGKTYADNPYMDTDPSYMDWLGGMMEFKASKPIRLFHINQLLS